MDELDRIRERLQKEKRQKNREDFPEIAKMMDEINARFPGSKLIWAKDLATGKEIGKKPVEKSVFKIPPNYHPTEAIDVRKGRGKTKRDA